MIAPIDSVEDLADQNDISYGTLEAGSTMTFFRVILDTTTTTATKNVLSVVALHNYLYGRLCVCSAAPAAGAQAVALEVKKKKERKLPTWPLSADEHRRRFLSRKKHIGSFPETI